jgi:hypothetical protein
MNNKSQVTIFVILGILIVATVVSVFVFKDYFIKNDFEREANKLKLNDEVLPIYNYFRDCISDVTYDGIKIMASQGGYLEIPDYNYPINPLLPFSNKLNLFDDGGLEVPYWFYETSNGIQTVQIPFVSEMQNSLNSYIKSGVIACANNFTVFEEYNVRGFDNLNVITNIDNNNVYVKVSSDMTVSHQGVEQQMNNVYVVLDTDFGKLYNEARDIFDELYYGNFTEEKTVDMLVLYDQLPFSFTEFSCDRKIWSKSDVMNDFRRILELNTFKYGDKNNKYFSLDTNYDDEVTFTYNSAWPTDVEIVGEGDILKGDEITGNSFAGSFLRSVFCVNDYKFIYNVKYPVLVRLGSDIDFMFAYQNLIKNNQPKVSLVSSTLTRQESQLCKNKIMPTQVNTNVGDVKINFKCFDTICDIGTTNSNGNLIENFPQCINGLIIVEKEGYKKSELLASTNTQTQNILFLDKIKDMNFKIKIIENGVVRDMMSDENIDIFFKNDDYSIALDKDSNTISLVSGDYEVSSIVTKNKKLNIPKQTIKECTSVPKEGLLGLVFREEKCLDIDIGGFDLDNVVIGGNNYNLEISQNDLKDGMTFYVNVYGVPESNDEILGIFDKIDGGSSVENFRYPEYA